MSAAYITADLVLDKREGPVRIPKAASSQLTDYLGVRRRLVVFVVVTVAPLQSEVGAEWRLLLCTYYSCGIVGMYQCIQDQAGRLTTVKSRQVLPVQQMFCQPLHLLLPLLQLFRSLAEFVLVELRKSYFIYQKEEWGRHSLQCPRLRSSLITENTG